MQSLKKLFPVLLGAGLLGAALYAAAGSADKATNTKVAFNAPNRNAVQNPVEAVVQKDSGTFFFGALPGGSYEEELAKYQPIADYLSRVTGKRFIYRYSDNWLSYSKNMASGAYDIVFDGPALNSWRIERINHTPIVKLPEEIVFVVVTRTDSRINQLKQLAGHRLCAVASPDMGTLALLSQFNNPARQPVLHETKDWQEAYKGVKEGKCAGSIMPSKGLETIDRRTMKVVYQHRPLPNQALSAGPRLSPELKDKIREALLTVPGKTATAKLRAAYGNSDFLPATSAEYVGFGQLLKNSLYYY